MTGAVVIAAGGTGGHLFPAQALAEELARRGTEVVLMTDDRGHQHATRFPKARIVTIPSATFAGRSVAGKALAVLRLVYGTLQAYFALARIRPSVAVGFGGYPALPTMFAAARRGLVCVIHEQNAVLGRVNRWLAPSAARIASSFGELVSLDPALKSRVAVTGNPVRPAVLDAVQPYSRGSAGRFNLLVFGGSQGARVFSTLVPEAVGKLPPDLRARIDVMQQCRQEDLAAANARYGDLGIKATLAPFFADMGQLLAGAQLVISRAGASTVAELCVAGRPALLVPYPYAMDDHQTANAQQVANAGAGWVLHERTLTAEALAAKITELAGTPELLEEAAAKALSLGRRDAASRLADLLEQAGRPGN